MIPLKKLHEIPLTRHGDTFLIGELVTNHITSLSGEPKAGKSALATGMALSLLNCDGTFLGQPIYRSVERVVSGLTDDGAEEELRARLEDAVPPDSVLVFHVEDTDRVGCWAEVRDMLIEQQADLFVLDNVPGPWVRRRTPRTRPPAGTSPRTCE